MSRIDGRKLDEKRPCGIKPNVLAYPDGSVEIAMGETRVICTAFVEEGVPSFKKDSGEGWVTAEYNMLPGSTLTRKRRSIGKIDGRSSEIQRLIGRSLRSIVDFKALGERTVTIDCDVIQADGGTRTASITGGYVALALAMKKLQKEGRLTAWPLRDQVVAISVGIVAGQACLDLCYREDSHAQVDMNVVMAGDGSIIEVQGTGEEAPFTRKELNDLLDLAEKGSCELAKLQREVLEI
ncbi:ribonuclease PH [Gottschalkiaceae bacterium SANA]|nr:ribonuclease PH [Gottschalkiaceae bacterium SANA]